MANLRDCYVSHAGTLFFTGVFMKNATTFEEQLKLLKSRGLIIADEEKCLDILRSANYYRLSAYLLPFKQFDNTFFEGTTFERIYRIYEFDRKLRSLLFSVIEEIELFLRSCFAYHFAHAHGALGYLDEANYNEYHNHDRFIESVETAIKNNRNTPVVKHHNTKYGGKLPIWAVVDFFSIGNLSYFYNDWPISDKTQIAKDIFNTSYPFMDNWLKGRSRF
jgi:abortive infection bacteriophage resistance protein